MNGEFQDRKDIDKIIHDLYKDDNVRAVLFGEGAYGKNSPYIDEKGELKTIEKILENYYDSGAIDTLIRDIAIGGVDVDLSDYVRKSDVEFNVSLEDNGCMIFDLSVGD